MTLFVTKVHGCHVKSTDCYELHANTISQNVDTFGNRFEIFTELQVLIFQGNYSLKFTCCKKNLAIPPNYCDFSYLQTTVKSSKALKKETLVDEIRSIQNEAPKVAR